MPPPPGTATGCGVGWSINGGKNDFFEIFKSYPLNLLLAMLNTSCENCIKIG